MSTIRKLSLIVLVSIIQLMLACLFGVWMRPLHLSTGALLFYVVVFNTPLAFLFAKARSKIEEK